MKLKDRNYLGFNHPKVEEKYNVKYVCELPIKFKTDRGEVQIACAVYKNFEKKEGYKDYMIMFFHGNNYMISGRSEKDLFSQWLVHGIHCKSCGEVIISMERHDYVTCDCENHAMIDGGGQPYWRYGAKDMNQIEMVTVNMRNGSIVASKDKP